MTATWVDLLELVCATVAATGAATIVWAIQGAQDALATGGASAPEFVPPPGVGAPVDEDEDEDADQDEDEDDD